MRGGALNRDWGLFERGGLFNLEKTMVSVLQKEVEYKVEKLKHKKMEVMQSKQIQRPASELKPSRIGPHAVLQSWLINTVYHLLVKNNKGEGMGLIWEGGLKEEFRYVHYVFHRVGGDANKCTKKRQGRANVCCFANLISCLHYSRLWQCKQLLEP